jgi:hypothetical protein
MNTEQAGAFSELWPSRHSAHGQADAFFSFVHLFHPYGDHIPHLKQLGGMPYPLGQLADMHQAVLMDPAY